MESVIKHSMPRNHSVLKKYNKALYDDILTSIRMMRRYVETTDYTLDSEEAFDVLETVLDDHPEIFYFNTQDIGFTSNGQKGALEFKYNYNSRTKNRMSTALYRKVDQIINNCIKDNMSYLEKEIAIHNYIVLNTTYDTKKNIDGLSYTDYGALMTKVAVSL